MGKMRRFFNFKNVIFCFIIVASITFCEGAGRRRLTSRSPPRFKQRITTLVPASHRARPTTLSPYRFRPSGPNRFFGAATLGPAQREGDSRKPICRKAHEIFAEPKDPSLYKVCVPIGQTWILYTYRCPSGTQFQEVSKKCEVMPTTTMATTISTPVSPPTQSSSTPKTMSTVNINDGNIIPSSPNNPPGIEIIPENGLESLESSSSSSEESLTNAPEMATNAISTTPIPSTSPTTPTTSTPTPEPKEVSSFIQDLINQGVMQKNQKDRFALFAKLLASTVKPQWEQASSYTKNQFSSLRPTTATPLRPTQQDGGDNTIWESLYNSENKKPTSPSTTVRSLLTRWKVVQNLDSATSTAPQAGRFPGLRPSPVIT